MLNEFPDFSQYELIFIGTPVWSFNLAPALNTFLSQYTFDHQKICLFCTFQGFGDQQCFKLISNRLSQANILSQHAFKNPLKQEPQLLKKEIQEWITSIEIN